MTFADKFQFIEGLEKGRKTKKQLHKETTSVADAFRSQYKREKNEKKAKKFTNSAPSSQCIGCGSDEHTSLERSTKCPAWGETCNSCGLSNHFKRVCKAKNKQQKSTEQSRNATSRSFDVTCTDQSSYFFSIGHLI